MKRPNESRRRPKLQITLGRASRLFQLVGLLAEGRNNRDSVLARLMVGLRTFYRELELLKKCGIKVKQTGKTYELHNLTVEDARGRLPFPDPQLSFAEMAELVSYPGEGAKRLAKLFETVTQPPASRKAAKQDGRPLSKESSATRGKTVKEKAKQKQQPK